MSTGYTDDLYEGKHVEFPDFVMKCARASNMLIMMRDEPLDAVVPVKFTGSSYHTEQIQMAEARLTRIEGWDDTEADRQAKAAYDRRFKQYEQELIGRKQLRTRYEAMLKQVKAWTPPTSKHQGLKDFMIKQLEISIDFDCGTDFLEVPERLTGTVYKKQQLNSALGDVTYHVEQDKVDKKLAEERSNWVNALRQSLTPNRDLETSTEA